MREDAEHILAGYRTGTHEPWALLEVDVIAMIKSGKANFYTNGNGGLSQEVAVVVLQDKDHLRSVKNGSPSDNLGMLPGFDPPIPPDIFGAAIPLMAAQRKAKQ